jgi:uncharacterized repeat protein (TIGR03806 family)
MEPLSCVWGMSSDRFGRYEASVSFNTALDGGGTVLAVGVPMLTRIAIVVTCAGWLVGCVDRPNPIPGPGQSTPCDRLSQMGIFQGPPAQLQPAPGIVAYDVNVSLYSDGAQKHRFMWLPPGTQIHATDDRWDIPEGAYFIKNFYFPNDARDPTRGIHLVETRFLVKHSDGLTVSTYVWKDDQSDAVASGGNVDVPVRWIDGNGGYHDESFHVPGVSLCETCHDDRLLGLRTRQMVHPGIYPDGTTDQASHLVAAGVLDATPAPGLVLVDPLGTEPLEQRARSYLDANCGHCHAQVGEASGTGLFWDYEDTDTAHLALCRRTTSVDGSDHVIVPGHPEQSEFLARMLSADPFARMPQGPTRVPDAAGIAVLSTWVQSMTPAGCP